MSEERIIPKKSSVYGKVPEAETLVLGELAINIRDKRFFSKDVDGAVFEIGESSFRKINTPDGSVVTTRKGAVDEGALTFTIKPNIDILSNTSTGTISFESPGASNGLEDRNDSIISLNSVARTVTITPVNTTTGFSYWNQGKKYTKYTAESVEFPDVTGLHWIYYDEDVLKYKTALFTTFGSDTTVAYVYWNAVDQSATIFADERHGSEMDWATHEYLHRTRGAVLASGLNATTYTISGDGSQNSHAQVGFANGTFFDEDLKVSVSHSNTPTLSFEQFISPYARIPLLYRSGTTGVWTKIAATDYPVKFGTSRIQYNYFNGSTWTLTDIDDKKYLAIFIVATNNEYEPIMGIIGQRQDSNLTQSQENAIWGNLSLEGLPLVEFRKLCAVYFLGDSSFTNDVKAAIRYVTDLRDLSNVSTSSTTPSHGDLVGLSDDDHLQYVHISQPRTITAAHTVNITSSANAFTINQLGTGNALGITGNTTVIGSLSANGVVINGYSVNASMWSRTFALMGS